jgi:hypothetical protein
MSTGMPIHSQLRITALEIIFNFHLWNLLMFKNHKLFHKNEQQWQELILRTSVFQSSRTLDSNTPFKPEAKIVDF